MSLKPVLLISSVKIIMRSKILKKPVTTLVKDSVYNKIQHKKEK